MSADTVLGVAVSRTDVEQAVLGTLRTWTRTYLRRLAVRYDKPETTLAPVAWWRSSGRLVQDAGEPLPTCIVMSPGMVGDPIDRGDGVYVARWDIRVGILVSVGGEQHDVQEVAGIYGLAVRLALMQHGDLGGVAIETVLRGETYDDLEPANEQSLGMVVVRFEVLVDEILDVNAGPPVPDPDDQDLALYEPPNPPFTLEVDIQQAEPDQEPTP